MKLSLKLKILSLVFCVLISGLFVLPLLQKRVERSMIDAFELEIWSEHSMLFDDMMTTQTDQLFNWVRPWFTKENLSPLYTSTIDRNKWRNNILSLMNIIDVQFGIKLVVTFDREGRVIVTHHQPGSPEIEFAQERFKETIRQAMHYEARASGVIVDHYGFPYLVSVIPSEDESGNVAFYHAFVIGFNDILKRYSKRIGQDVFIEFNGRLLTNSDNDYVLKQGVMVDTFNYKGHSYKRRTIKFDSQRYFFESDQIYLHVIADVTGVNRVLSSNQHIYLIVAIVALLFAGVLIIFALKRFFRPLDQIVHVVKSVASGKFDERVTVFSRDETGQVAHAINMMLDQLEVRDRKLNELINELKNYKAQTINAEKLSVLGQMTGAVVHEIKNPLSIIKMANEMVGMSLQRCAENGDLRHELDKIKNKQQGINSGVIRIEKIIRSVLAFARDGKQDPFVLTSVPTILEDTYELCAKKIAGSNVKFHSIPECPGEIECRATQITQVLVNLLNNALDAVLELSGQRWIKLECECRKDVVIFSVTDSGFGISIENQEKMMKPFYTSKAVGKGTGLGLSISRDIVEVHHGRFFIDNECPNTRFVVELPKSHNGVPENAEKNLIDVLHDIE